jgi:hypothetical protein
MLTDTQVHMQLDEKRDIFVENNQVFITNDLVITDVMYFKMKYLKSSLSLGDSVQILRFSPKYSIMLKSNQEKETFYITKAEPDDYFKVVGQLCSWNDLYKEKIINFLKKKVIAIKFAAKLAGVRQELDNVNKKLEEAIRQKNMLKELVEADSQECPVCLVEIKQNMHVLKCCHYLCKECSTKITECPLCRVPLNQ